MASVPKDEFIATDPGGVWQYYLREKKFQADSNDVVDDPEDDCTGDASELTFRQLLEMSVIESLTVSILSCHDSAIRHTDSCKPPSKQRWQSFLQLDIVVAACSKLLTA